MPLHIIIHAQIKDPAAFEALRNEMPRHVERTEPGTVDYRWWRETDGDQVTLVDSYASPSHFVQHFQAMQQAGFVERLMASCDIGSVHAQGDTDDAAEAILDQLGAVRYDQVAGFTRPAPIAP